VEVNNNSLNIVNMDILAENETLIDELLDINSKLQIKLSDGGCIEASFWENNGIDDIAVSFSHDKGEIRMVSPFALNRDKYDESDIEEMGGEFDSEEEFEEWLDEIADYQDRILTFYRPGLEIFEILNNEEKEDIGMEIEFQPDSMNTCENVIVRDVEKLKKLLLKYDIPFYFGDNIHPQLRDFVVSFCEYFNVPSSEKKIKEFADELRFPHFPTLYETDKTFRDVKANTDKMPTTAEFGRVYSEVMKKLRINKGHLFP